VNRETAIVAGLWASLPMDYLVKVSGMSKVNTDLVDQLPAPLTHALVPELLNRTLRLNCLTQEYAPIWQELMGTPWTMESPLRKDFDRRAALIEIDALVSIMLGMSAEQLCAVFRSQFNVLRKYEWEMYFHPDGHKIGESANNKGARQTDYETDMLKAYNKARRAPEKYDEMPPVPSDWIKPDREAEMTAAYRRFVRQFADLEAAESVGGRDAKGAVS
jgi:hypothetical protein